MLYLMQTKRGAKGMSPEVAQRLAVDAMIHATSTRGDALMTLGQARVKMDHETVLPNAVLRILEEVFLRIFHIPGCSCYQHLFNNI